MNIHKRYIIIVFLGCISTTQSYAANNLKSDPSVNGGWDCGILVVHIGKSILNDYIRKEVVMRRGNFTSCVSEDDEVVCRFSQDLLGIDAALSFKSKTSGPTASIRMLQNFCFFEAGEITVLPMRGEWKYTTREGSWGDNFPGFIWLDKVSFNY